VILGAVWVFDFEGQKHFFAVLSLAVAGFAVHAWLPPNLRTGFFCLLSLAGILFILGWQNGAWLIGLGSGLILLARLPAPLLVRVLLLAAVGVQLAACRVQFPAAFWPILGSMFMFRLMVYLFALRQRAPRPPWMHTLAYFFMLPNICFPFFPVVDFRTFQQTYYDEEEYRVYDAGIGWMVRGLTHLLAYRFIKYFVLPSPHQVHDLPHLALFLAANYGLYLRVSGQFHLIVGILHLFGYRLPRTHDHYFLASSFADIWRRINIYWKDFMAKQFFWPAFYTLRGWGRGPALLAATFWVFLATWLLHSYQFFWLLGELPASPREAYLWIGAGFLVAINLLHEVRRVSRREHVSGRGGLTAAALHALQVAGMFGLVSLFWACWTIAGFMPAIRAIRIHEINIPQTCSLVAICLAAVAAIGVLARLLGDWFQHTAARERWAAPSGTLLFRLGVPLGLLALSSPWARELAGSVGGEMIATLRLDAYTPLEVVQTVRGYYEEVTETPVQAGPLLGILAGKERPPLGGADYTKMTRTTDDWLERELIPGWSGELAGSRVRVNSAGMRDREGIPLAKPPGSCRIALVGSSVVMGFGVEDDQVFKVLLEERLNAQRPEHARIELLNFGAGLNFAIHRHVMIDRKVLAYQPDAIYYFAHQDEWLGPVQHLAKLVARRDELPYPCLNEVIQEAGITPDMAWGLIDARLRANAPALLRCIYRDLVAECRRNSILPVWIYLPVPGVVSGPVYAAELVQLAAECGFVVVDLSGWAEGYRPEEVKLTAADHHPNALGHQIIAARLEAVLRERPELLPACARAR
jgi:hypothetical protein